MKKGMFLVLCLVLVIGINCCRAADIKNSALGKSISGFSNIETRHVDIYSDGTRISGDLFYPKGAKKGDNLPAIILCHGWGGERSHLNTAYAPYFAAEGYVVLTFDYRGWGDSDSRLVIKGEMPKPGKNGEVTVRATAIRELVDPVDQTTDIISAIDYISGEPMVDSRRIGLWGTSFGGGHVVYVAARDPRVKCIVSQVPSMSGKWVYQYFKPEKMAIERARGEIEPVPQGENKIAGLNGTPHLSRIADYSPVSLSRQIKIPVFIIVASKDELIDNREHGQKVYTIVKKNAPAQYKVFNGTHFEIYSSGKAWAIQSALQWYNQHL